ncbi:SDR family oxidoreductase [Xylanimonas ulmi]|uniref:NAD(P)-dependent dehydrogenase (Short-subunit alcohol dehydrogenase family) n=1 Tax=Xylanimonas ulmi TaxID=228973 RepID=A0A4Q7M4W7_9MICO|nr:NAD(P)-dependent dehydrogenase (short-subunit alcohol dehydrogenase family) [Xylanibacterium ulmi]
MRRLEDKVAVITGAGSGMGRATARLFVAEGAKVVIADINDDNAKAAADEFGDAAIAVHVDVSKADDVQAMLDAAVTTFGKVDILFNNAGFSGPHQPLDAVDDAFLDTLYGVNLRGVYLGIKYVIPHLRANGGGVVINTASAMGLKGRKGLAAYGAMKGGVVALTYGAALDLAEDNIRVNSICPGMIFTGLAGAAADGSSKVPDYAGASALGRFGRAEEIASAALFLASDDSSFVTGVNLPVDGGMVAG